MSVFLFLVLFAFKENMVLFLGANKDISKLCIDYLTPLIFFLPVNIRVLSHTVVNGSSEMVTNISSGITTILFNTIMMKYLGVNGVSAIRMMMYIDFILIALGLGYAQGVSPVISYNYGKRSKQNLHLLLKNSFIICGVLNCFLTVSVFLPKGNLR